MVSAESPDASPPEGGGRDVFARSAQARKPSVRKRTVIPDPDFDAGESTPPSHSSSAPPAPPKPASPFTRSQGAAKRKPKRKPSPTAEKTDRPRTSRGGEGSRPSQTADAFTRRAPRERPRARSSEGAREAITDTTADALSPVSEGSPKSESGAATARRSTASSVDVMNGKPVSSLPAEPDSNAGDRPPPAAPSPAGGSSVASPKRPQPKKAKSKSKDKASTRAAAVKAKRDEGKGTVAAAADVAKDEAKDALVSSALSKVAGAGVGDAAGLDVLSDAAKGAKQAVTGDGTFGGRIRGAGTAALAGGRAALRYYVPGGQIVDTVLSKIGYKRVFKFAGMTIVVNMVMGILICVLGVSLIFSMAASAASPTKFLGDMIDDLPDSVKSWFNSGDDEENLPQAGFCAAVPSLSDTSAPTTPSSSASGSAAPTPTSIPSPARGSLYTGGVAGKDVAAVARMVPEGSDLFIAQAWMFAAGADKQIREAGWNAFVASLATATPKPPRGIGQVNTTTSAPLKTTTPPTTSTTGPPTTPSAPWTTPVLVRPFIEGERSRRSTPTTTTTAPSSASTSPSSVGASGDPIERFRDKGWSPLDVANGLVHSRDHDWSPYLYPVYGQATGLLYADKVKDSGDDASAMIANLEAVCQHGN